MRYKRYSVRYRTERVLEYWRTPHKREWWAHWGQYHTIATLRRWINDYTLQLDQQYAKEIREIIRE